MKTQKQQCCADMGICSCDRQHTPTPWKYQIAPLYIDGMQSNGTCTVSNSEGTVMQNIDTKTAAFIVRAVNNHKALLGYVKDLMEFEQARISSHGLNNYPRPSIEYIDGIKKAIAQAEVK